MAMPKAIGHAGGPEPNCDECDVALQAVPGTGGQGCEAGLLGQGAGLGTRAGSGLEGEPGQGASGARGRTGTHALYSETIRERTIVQTEWNH